MAVKLNGYTKYIMMAVALLGIFASFIISHTMKADRSDVVEVQKRVTAACSRVTAVEKDAEHNKDAILRVETKVDKIYDLLLKEAGNNP